MDIFLITNIILISKQDNDIMEYIKVKLKKKNNNKLFYGKYWEVFKIKKNKFILNLNNKKQIINKPTLIGNHQIENASLAIASCYEIKKYGYKEFNEVLTIVANRTVERIVNLEYTSYKKETKKVMSIIYAKFKRLNLNRNE